MKQKIAEEEGLSGAMVDCRNSNMPNSSVFDVEEECVEAEEECIEAEDDCGEEAEEECEEAEDECREAE